ncbi:MAG: serine/threonine protein kinase [Planctomycetes bacterium]|nr:serine/threonine protein kinase [Planctomycetota bacterium]
MVRELARGGMGVVLVARHPELDREVALKLLLSEAASPQAVARFEAEAQALGRLAHPGIVAVHAYGHEGQHPYLVMELVEGEALDEVLKRDGPLEARRAAELLAQLSDALEAAHQAGVLHRDLKPANVLLDRAGQPRVTDFGIAKDVERETLTQTGQVLGTPAYMAPEQAAGERARFGPATDVYGLGATLYALLAGHPPFRGASAMNLLVAVMHKPYEPLPPEVDPALSAICARCL